MMSTSPQISGERLKRSQQQQRLMMIIIMMIMMANQQRRRLSLRHANLMTPVALRPQPEIEEDRIVTNRYYALHNCRRPTHNRRRKIPVRKAEVNQVRRRRLTHGNSRIWRENVRKSNSVIIMESALKQTTALGA